MEEHMGAILSLIVLVPLIYFLPIGLTRLGKGLIIMLAFVFANLGILSSDDFPLWQTALVLLLLTLLSVYLLVKKFDKYLFLTRDHAEDVSDALQPVVQDDEIDLVKAEMETTFDRIKEEVTIVDSSYDEVETLQPSEVIHEAEKSEEQEKLENSEELEERKELLNLDEIEAEDNLDVSKALEKTQEMVVTDGAIERDDVEIEIFPDRDILVEEEVVYDQEAIIEKEFIAEIEEMLPPTEEKVIKQSKNERLGLTNEMLIYEDDLQEKGKHDDDLIEETTTLESDENHSEWHPLIIEQHIQEEAATSIESKENVEIYSTEVGEPTLEKCDPEQTIVEEQQPTELQKQIFQTVLDELVLVKNGYTSYQYEELIKDYMQLVITTQERYTLSMMLIEHYLTEKEIDKLQELLHSLNGEFGQYPILDKEIQYLLEEYCEKTR